MFTDPNWRSQECQQICKLGDSQASVLNHETPKTIIYKTQFIVSVKFGKIIACLQLTNWHRFSRTQTITWTFAMSDAEKGCR